MPQVRIGRTEKWPVFEVSKDEKDPVFDLTDEELGIIRAAEHIYTEAQTLMWRKWRGRGRVWP